MGVLAMLETVIVIISSLILIAVIIAIVLLIINSKKKTELPQLDLKEIGALQQQLTMLTEQMKTNIKLSVSEEMNKILEKADHLLRLGTVEDIMEFIPDLLLFYTQIDDQNAENEINLD